MMQGGTRSLEEARRETELTRMGLTRTVDELRSTVNETAAEIRHRLRPDTIKAEVSGYIRNRREQLLHDVTEAARRNPMQAVAVGASMAYPLMRLARSIPLPILMIGAGLFFAGSKTGRDLTQKASDMAGDVTDDMRRRASDLGGQLSEFGDQVSRAASDAKDYASDSIDRAREAVSGGAEQVQRAGASAAETARDGMASNVRNLRDSAAAAGSTVSNRIDELKDKASDTAELASSSAKAKASDAMDAVRQTAANTARAGQELLNTARERAADAGQRAGQTMRETVEQNPLLVAGVGLLVGGLIASALPKFEAEEDLMGTASGAVKRRARDAAAKGFETAKSAADEILSNVAERADAEGLTPEGIARGAQDVTQRLQRVAERAVTTAFDPDTQDQGQGERPEGQNSATQNKQDGRGEYHG